MTISGHPAQPEVLNNDLMARLPPEIRLNIYELLLDHPHRALYPNGPSYCDDQPSCGVQHVFTNILATCQMIYNEALPILYGKNILVFHDGIIAKNLLHIPSKHLKLVKHVLVIFEPLVFGSTRKMAKLLKKLAHPSVHLLDLTFSVYLHRGHAEIMREDFIEIPCPNPKETDKYLYGKNPIVPTLFQFKTVKDFTIILYDEARLKRGVAGKLKSNFMEGGSVEGQSITIMKKCAVWHDLDREIKCPVCAHARKELCDRTAIWDWDDDRHSYEAMGE